MTSENILKAADMLDELISSCNVMESAPSNIDGYDDDIAMSLYTVYPKEYLGDIPEKWSGPKKCGYIRGFSQGYDMSLKNIEKDIRQIFNLLLTEYPELKKNYGDEVELK